MKRRLEQIDNSIARYLGRLDSADHEEPSIAAASGERLNEKIAALKEEMQRLIKRWEHEEALDDMQARLDAHPETMRVRRRTAEHPFGTLRGHSAT